VFGDTEGETEQKEGHRKEKARQKMKSSFIEYCTWAWRQ
jgi:hypothetical protein